MSHETRQAREAEICLLTGPVGVGKTTVAERVVGLARRRGFACGGLLAPSMLNSCGQKIGIWGVEILTGQRRVLARTDRDLDGPEVGSYSFDAAAMAWAAGVVQGAVGACDLLVVDEIGKLELWRDTGLVPILPILASGEVNRSLVLVRDFLLIELRERLDSVQQVVFRVAEDNRGELPALILKWILEPSVGSER